MPQFHCVLGKNTYCHVKTPCKRHGIMKAKRNTTEIFPTAETKDPCLHWQHPGHKIITQKSLITPQDVPVTQTVDHAGRNVWSVHDLMKCVPSVQC